ncbi:hypothetical protein IVA80_16960 [Bradyrhizobium sp. 139]|uniref:hypothetical protein n=1 Tax=Bradyrhizobium sp. 139 TaxID=2782616 RepID=UPI001FFB5497|nr:hypothetical protein [Bradyrhizobium sp. 139]MCK1742509.1 hypothetical protein [Bradyrhizobium sp. 139]
MTDLTVPPPETPSKEMTAAAFGGPAYAMTNFMIHPLSAEILRLSFVEAPAGGDPQFRTAVIMDRQGAINLADLLMRFVAGTEVGTGA